MIPAVMYRWFLTLLAGLPLCAQTEVHNTRAAPVEYGRIDWRRGYELARAEARSARLPLLMLFQEVPG